MKNRLILLPVMILSFPAYAQEAAPKAMAEKISPAKPHHQAAPDNLLGKCRSLLMTVSPKDECLLESANLEIHFNVNNNKSFAEARADFDKVVKQISDFAIQQKIEHIKLQSVHYSFHPEKETVANAQPASLYHIDGTAFFHLDSSSDAYHFAEFLTEKKFRVGMKIHQPCDPNHKDSSDDTTDDTAE